jgi:CDP-paratose synthetase
MLKRKTAVITGGRGFIGRNLAVHLAARGWKIVLVIRETERLSIEGPPCVFEYIKYDGTSKSLEVLPIKQDEDVVFFHLAANSTVDKELDALDELLNSNVSFGAAILGYMARSGFRHIVVAESYWQFSSSNHFAGNTLYAATKNSLGVVIKYFRRYNINPVRLVIYDTYGPNDTRAKLVNLLIKSALDRVWLPLTPGHQKLDLVFIEDVVTAFECAGEGLLADSFCDRKEMRFSVRTGKKISVREVVRIVGEVVGSYPNVKFGELPYGTHQRSTYARQRHFQPVLNWEPRYLFIEGLRKMVEHLKCQRTR